MKALRIEIRSKRDPVGQAGFNIELVENAVPISGGAGFLRGFLFVDQPLRMLGLEIVIGIGEERFGSSDEFGIAVAQTEGGSSVGRPALDVQGEIARTSSVGGVGVE